MSAPAFQFYPADFLVGCADLSAEETGAYIRLLCYQWSKDGLPDDDAKLAAMGGCHGNAIASIRHKFGICADGKLRNLRLEEVRSDQDRYRAKQAENANKRWANRGKTENATALPTQMPNACPSSSPSTTTTKKPAAKEPKPLLLDDDWLTSLQSNPAYAGINVRIELGKAEVWCGVNHRQCTRKFFTNWLNRAFADHRTIKTNGTAQTAPASPHNNNLNRGAVSDYRKHGEKLSLGVAAVGPGNPGGSNGAANHAA